MGLKRVEKYGLSYLRLASARSEWEDLSSPPLLMYNSSKRTARNCIISVSFMKQTSFCFVLGSNPLQEDFCSLAVAVYLITFQNSI